MSVISYAEARHALQEAATPLDHPTKTYDNGDPRPFGKILYIEGGTVGVLVDGRYLVAAGEDHQESVYALAHELGYSKADVGVPVEEVTREAFYRLATG